MNSVKKQAAFFRKAKNQLEQQLPFVLYNKPNSDLLIGIFQSDKKEYQVKDFTETGFVFAPFDGSQILLIPESAAEIVQVKWSKGSYYSSYFNETASENTIARSHFEQLIQKGINAIEEGIFDKVVLSRKETVVLNSQDITAIFTRLLDEYPTAFTYCFFHPISGLWFGAFSEQLLKIHNTSIETMAVAGTQPYSDNIIWENKEKQEQQYVTDFILKHLEGYVEEIKISEPYTMKAGQVAHLKTDISGNMASGSGLRDIIRILHPTPAVCGLPKEIAKEFILKNENYDRDYYSGYLGELNKNFSNAQQATDIYVNLRCMKITDNVADLYIGCGVTKNSIPEKEWYETVRKAETMKQILEIKNT